MLAEISLLAAEASDAYSVGYIFGRVTVFVLIGAGIAFAIYKAVSQNNGASYVPPPPAMQPPAGWHPDPHGQARERYWDGARWTEHTRA